MTRTQYFVAASLDGYIADAQDKIDWLLAFDGTPGLREHYESFMTGIGALAMGSRTYDFILKEGSPWPYGDRPTYVFTQREWPKIADADLRFVRGDVAPLRAELLAAAGGKNLWLVGGGALAAQFQRIGLIDELWLSVIPVVLGDGAPIFGDATIGALTLRNATQFARGIVELRYALSALEQ